ncbi:MAG TPA: histidine kinase [Actinomycetes bacterium]|nr:histidine kinase [Actinomycetes bacterium]
MDALVFLAAVVVGLLVIGGRLDASTPMPPGWLLTADVAAGAVGCAGLWLRRRWPVGLALVLIALSTFSESVAGAMVLGLLTVAIHRPPRTTAAVFAVSLVAGLVYVVVRPEPGVPGWFLLLMGAIVQGAAVGWGLFIHYRRQLVLSLRDRAARAETEAQLRAEQVQQRAREEIAREMHDVLGHRLSLLSVHAGALEFRPDAPSEEIAGAAKVIRENAHQALQDLREVLGVLRAPVGELPQPTLADLPQLVSESGRAGMRVDLRQGTDGAVPDLVGRTAYRVVQEALTNARKHAPGAEVRVAVTGAPDLGLTVEVANGPPEPGAGSGPEAGAGAKARSGLGSGAPGEADPGPAPGPPVTAGRGARHPNPPLPGPPVGERSRSADGDAARYPQPRSPQPPSPQPRSGQGLAGLAERVALAGGRLEHGPTPSGGWRLAAWLPWPP